MNFCRIDYYVLGPVQQLIAFIQRPVLQTRNTWSNLHQILIKFQTFWHFYHFQATFGPENNICDVFYTLVVNVKICWGLPWWNRRWCGGAPAPSTASPAGPGRRRPAFAPACRAFPGNRLVATTSRRGQNGRNRRGTSWTYHWHTLGSAGTAWRTFPNYIFDRVSKEL